MEFGEWFYPSAAATASQPGSTAGEGSAGGRDAASKKAASGDVVPRAADDPGRNSNHSDPARSRNGSVARGKPQKSGSSQNDEVHPATIVRGHASGATDPAGDEWEIEDPDDGPADKIPIPLTGAHHDPDAGHRIGPRFESLDYGSS